VLADIGGRPMLEHVWRGACAAGFDRVLVATDDARVAAAAAAFGAEVVLTGEAPSGTHRVAAAVGEARVRVVNVQADQPFVDPDHLSEICACLGEGAEVATLSAPFGDPADAGEPARVKVTVDEGGRAVDFSRRPLPGARMHLGVYGFGVGWVGRCASVPPSPRSSAEDLEQLAWLDAGIAIHVRSVGRSWPSVDTEADLARARHRAVTGPTAGEPRASTTIRSQGG
jgi:3-deoxy-manno-octulosonate cytidylyltransferase (CMP-KDO synthetase)